MDLCGLCHGGIGVAKTPPFSFVAGNALAQAFSGLSGPQLLAAYPFMWWTHFMLWTTLLAILPWTKAKHIVTSSLNLYFHDPTRQSRPALTKPFDLQRLRQLLSAVRDDDGGLAMRGERGLNYGDYAYIEYFPRGMFQFQPDPNLGRQQQIFQIWIRPVEPQNGHFTLRAALYEYDKLIRNGMTPDDFESTRQFLMKFVNILTATQDAQLGYALDSRYYKIKDFPAYMREQLAKLYHESKSQGDDRRSRATVNKLKAIDPSFDVERAPPPQTKAKSGKSSELVFLDLGEEPAPPRPAPRATPAPRPAAKAAPPPEPVPPPLEVEPTALVEEPAPPEPVEDLPVQRASVEFDSRGVEAGTMDGLMGTMAEPPVAPPPLDFEPTAVDDVAAPAEIPMLEIEIETPQPALEIESRMAGGLAAEEGAIEVPDLVLSVRAIPSIDTCEKRLVCEAEHRSQRHHRPGDQLGVGLLERARVTCAADEGPQQNAAFGCTVRPLRRQPGTGEDARLLHPRDDESGSVERVRHRLTPERQRHSRGRLVPDIHALPCELRVEFADYRSRNERGRGDDQGTGFERHARRRGDPEPQRRQPRIVGEIRG